ncbi:unnamed protein product [Brachionus calyciflorus]|uniref:HAT C-terminal dimerisation domain-containing protein n=1 Tax=Brachionus calyciflorus TaxID=104777 RepID=A0A814G7I4_9BILA|nr:unnamed protein product [Brachionus calyciflorus]
MVKSFLQFSDEELEKIFERKFIISASQRTTLEELVKVLEGFDLITTMIQTDNFSIGHILPLLKGLKIELTNLPTLKFCEKIKKNLLASLEKRFSYLESSEIYNLAAILTPKYASSNIITDSDSDILERPTKKIKLLSYLNTPVSVLSQTCQTKNLRLKFTEYLCEIDKPCNFQLDNSAFWMKYKDNWCELAAFAKYILNVPATSASVERIFSVGGAILRPSRRCITDKVFEQLIFLKWNLN